MLYAKKALTEAEKKTYDFIREYTEEKKYPPSTMEMCAGLCLASTATVNRRVRHLREKGWIDYLDGKSRTIRIT